MARLQTLRKLRSEDFKDQNPWIQNLIIPLNSFMEATQAAQNHALTINENMLGQIVTITLDGTYPVKLPWGYKTRPVAVQKGNLTRSDGSSFTIMTAVDFQWSFNAAGQIQIDTVVGLPVAASPAIKYLLTIICFGG